MNVLKPGNEDLLKAYAKHYNADTSNGIIFIRTKAHIEEKKANPEKGPVVVVVAKKPEAEVAEKNNKGVSLWIPLRPMVHSTWWNRCPSILAA
jgi:hypothetical protein